MALAPEMKETFCSLNSVRPSSGSVEECTVRAILVRFADLYGFHQQAKEADFLNPVSYRIKRDATLCLGDLIRRGWNSLTPSGAVARPASGGHAQKASV